MAKIEFWHNAIQWLEVDTGINEVQWAYGLNTAKFPTYGGEVIQILSVYIDDLSLEGEVKSYAEMEGIYNYFNKYFQHASQGNKGTGDYNQEFMTMHYPERNWEFFIQPLAMPGFSYSRDTVAPSWKMSAHIVDNTSENYEELTKMAAKEILNEHSEPNNTFSLKGEISMGSASPENNPFASYGTAYENNFVPGTEKKVEAGLKEAADFYNTLLPSYLTGDYESLLKGAAKPAFGEQAITQAQLETEEASYNTEQEGILAQEQKRFQKAEQKK